MKPVYSLPFVLSWCLEPRYSKVAVDSLAPEQLCSVGSLVIQLHSTLTAFCSTSLCVHKARVRRMNAAKRWFWMTRQTVEWLLDTCLAPRSTVRPSSGLQELAQNMVGHPPVTALQRNKFTWRVLSEFRKKHMWHFYFYFV